MLGGGSIGALLTVPTWGRSGSGVPSGKVAGRDVGPDAAPEAVVVLTMVAAVAAGTSQENSASQVAATVLWGPPMSTPESPSVLPYAECDPMDRQFSTTLPQFLVEKAPPWCSVSASRSDQNRTKTTEFRRNRISGGLGWLCMG